MIDLSKLNEKQLEFLNEELGVSAEQLENMTEEELDTLYDSVADIEIEESMRCQNTAMSPRGDTAVGVVDTLSDVLGYPA